MNLQSLNTPAALIDVARMNHNIARMQQRLDALGVAFRPHVKTTKCEPVVRAQLEAGACGITVSTLKEAEQFFAAGISDVVYAVGIAPGKLPQALALRRAGCDLKLVTDSVASAEAIVAFGQEHSEAFEIWIEIDVDGHRSGIPPEDATLISVATALVEGGMHLGGVIAHAGSSYEYDTPEALAHIAEQERAGTVRAAQRLREAGLPCEVVSIGSTPTALAAGHLEGVTEVRAGVYVFFDLVMHNVGVNETSEIALSVLTTVIGHQAEKGWVIVDAGWMAMSRDRGTQKQKQDFGYGLVCNEQGEVLDSYLMSGANQEHGIISHVGTPDHDIEKRFPIGTRLRILPNHACATGAQYPDYIAVKPDGELQTWPRFHGW
ncbi:D-serine deaminase-like pyridoxal phosphate-dependent protein [Paraburkholderia tropica]|uniref:D-serine deaminase-like pyridoxal phosphate-dependent protein n=1 Tax=Paraburkholderia tropica TaxID=92647 RepID=A0ABX5MD47_9BURK|nr:DSD1 family PLP-dependent enzyme [Paraburkholderia tropica]MBB3005032.1 D-serine deaminase-like pyridoxal phosphate-dependent protein [Paraburkholderia tropica]MBB6324031.1 D-serine deaminase-like pyridoxal phosphate-dependent protein [Paraburkholderia tropica]PXX06171.1 D-serine deaminase-like pyridoxal phosphate-dependent protein [Paraburkholderia tropica]PZW72026.1 D-serine deaminase-like pyridoxal phosphate-dependent protein [Paraburkholderia tropica]